MQTTLLINYDDILHYTSISGNIDEYKISPHIHSAQILYLEPILGTNLYDKVVSMVADKSITGSTDYNKLYDEYIIPSVVFHALEIFIPFNSYQIADGGTFRHQATNSNYSPMDEIDRIVAKYRLIGSKFDKKLVDFLCINSNLYSEYNNNTGLVKKTETTMRAGIYTGIRHSK